jgi:predicted DNA-binding transcriptional regulator AlpA
MKMAFDISNDRLIGIEEICEKLGLTKRTFRRMRSPEHIEYLDTKNRPFPDPVCYLTGGKSPKWAVSDVNKWIATRAKPIYRDGGGKWGEAPKPTTKNSQNVLSVVDTPTE